MQNLRKLALSLALSVTVGLTFSAFGVASALAAESDSDSQAVAIAERSLEALGGAKAWEESRFFRFDFFGFRTHYLDRYTGRHRLEGKSKEGVAYVVLMNVNSHEGEVYLDGKKAEGDAAKEWLERAYGAYINDTYWLLMPYKMLDPGVHLHLDGSETIEGVTYDKLKLTFGKVGLTPGDTYWAYINRETGLMDRWDYFLEGWAADKMPTSWLWLDWQRHGGILLSARRKNLEDGSERALGQLGVFKALPESVFSSQTAVEAPAEN